MRNVMGNYLCGRCGAIHPADYIHDSIVSSTSSFTTITVDRLPHIPTGSRLVADPVIVRQRCEYCGSRAPDDYYGNCAACGGPR